MTDAALTQTINIVPVQGIFSETGVCVGLVGPGGEFFSPPINSDVIQNSTIDSSPIGSTTPSTGVFTTVTSTGLATFNNFASSNVNITGGSISGVSVTINSLNNTPVGNITPSTGAFTSLSSTSLTVTNTISGSINGNAATATYATTAVSATTAGSATTATTATNLAGGAAGSIPYQTGAGATSMLATGTGVLVGGVTPSYSTTPTLTGTNITGIPNAGLLNSSLTIGTTSIALGATASTLTAVTLANPTVSNYGIFTSTSAPSYAEGCLWYDSTQKALAYFNDVTNNTLHIGQETQLKVYNNTGSTISRGAPVYITSTSSGFTYPLVALAKADTQTTGNAIGLANQDIPTATAGYVVISGLVNGLSLGAMTVGDTVYVSPYSAGQLMNTYPPTGYPVKIGVVAYANTPNGAIYVNQSNSYVLAGSVVGTLAIANGGTNATTTPTAGAVAFGTGTAYSFTAAGTSGQVLTSAGSGTPTWSTPTAYATVTDDTTTASVRYPLFANQTSGNISTEYTSSTKLQYTPSTGLLAATTFSGSGANLTNIPNAALTNSSITIGSTAVSLGGTVTTIAGLTSVTSTTFVGALTGNASTATSATTATNATNIAITDNTSSVSTYYPVISSATTGNVGAITSSTKLSFVPSTGVLSATSFAGAGTGLTGTASSLSIGGNAANVTGTVAVANGGTGVTTSTGTGNVVLSTSPTLTTPTITIKDNVFTLQDDVDATKQAQFQLSSLTTGTTFTFTLPAVNSTVATLAAQTFAGQQTFSNATNNFGTSTAAGTINLASGATTTGLTKTVNIGTGGVSGSTTTINIGSAVSGATTTTSAYGAWTFNSTVKASQLIIAP